MRLALPKFLRSVLAAGVATLALGAVSADAKTLTVAHTGTPGNSVYVFFDVFAKELAARSKGSLDAKVHPSGELGGDDQLLQQMGLGTIDVTSVATANMGAMTDAYLWTDLPYVFASRAHAEKVFGDAEIAGMLAGKVEGPVGSKVLGYIQVGGYRMLQNTARELRTPADAAGLKFRVTASPIDVATIKAWGGLPTPVAWAETFTAVQQGVVDGMNLQASWTALGGFGQVIKYATRNQAVMAFHVAQINTGVWDGLSDEEKKAVSEAADVARKAANEADQAAEADFLAKLTQQGVTVYEPTAEEISAWRDAALPVWSEVEGKVDASLLAKVAALKSAQ